MTDKKVKPVLKEKFVIIYEGFFKGEDFSQKNFLFWQELFLLKINSNFIINEFKSISNDDFQKLKANVGFLYSKSIELLKNETNQIRIYNIILTLYLFTHCISINKQLKLKSYELLEILVGNENAEDKFQIVFDIINSILVNETPKVLKEVCFKYLLSLVTLNENLDENVFIDYFMLNSSLFEALITIVSELKSRIMLGKDALLLLTLLLQYRKYESENPYVGKLSLLDSELALTGLAQIMSSVLVKYNQLYATERKQQEGESWWNNVGSFIGNIFVGDEERKRIFRLDDAILLIFYECIHLNRNFISTLTHAATEFTSDEQPQLTTEEALTKPALSPQTSNNSLKEDNLNTSNDTDNQIQTSHPSNLFVVFLETCSVILQEPKLDANQAYDSVKLFFIILLYISEDEYANSLLNDPNMTFSVFLYQAKLRHRKLSYDRSPPSRQLVCTVLDLMIEFMQSHLMKNFPFELYMRAIGIIQRLMCYQKKYKVRVQYQWQNLWTCLMNTLKFIVSYDTVLLSKNDNIFLLCSKVVAIFNIFITFGDTFLPNPEAYDYLYYDVLRMRQIFENLALFANRYISIPEWKEHVTRLIFQMSNLKSIISHFGPKIDTWSQANHISSLSEQQVLDVVRANYDTLILKLEDNLDQYERYSERPYETQFFNQLVRRITNEAKSSIDMSKFDQVNILHELAVTQT